MFLDLITKIEKLIEPYGIKNIYILFQIILLIIVLLRKKINKYFDSSVTLSLLGISLAIFCAAVIFFKMEETIWLYIFGLIVNIAIGAYGLTEIKAE